MDRVGVLTTARVRGGHIEHLERHARRLARDAGRLGLPRPDQHVIEALALEVVGDRLGGSDGILRIEWSPPEGAAEARSGPPFALQATTRPLGPEPRTWRAAIAQTVHPGPGTLRNTKAIGVPAWDAARAERTAAGVEEVLLLDAGGRLVEGSRTNLIVVTRDARMLSPARHLGPVEGLGLEIVRECLGGDGVHESGAIDRAMLSEASELIAVNAVRGAAAIVEIDGRPMGDGREGPIALRLRALFARG